MQKCKTNKLFLSNLLLDLVLHFNCKFYYYVCCMYTGMSYSTCVKLTRQLLGVNFLTFTVGSISGYKELAKSPFTYGIGWLAPEASEVLCD